MGSLAGVTGANPLVVNQSLIDRLHPRTRLLSAVVFVMVFVALHNLWTLVLALVAALSLVALARLPLASLRQRMTHVEGFMVLLFVVLPFTTPGEPVAALGPLSISAEGLLLTATIVLTVNASVLAIFALLSTLEPVRLGHTLASLRVPDKLVHLLLFTVRYIAVFRAETARLREAMRARAFTAGSNRHTWRTFGNLVGMMLIRSLERAERVDEAMRCRGFTGKLPMIVMQEQARGDRVFALVSGLLILSLLGLDWWL